MPFTKNFVPLRRMKRPLTVKALPLVARCALFESPRFGYPAVAALCCIVAGAPTCDCDPPQPANIKMAAQMTTAQRLKSETFIVPSDLLRNGSSAPRWIMRLRTHLLKRTDHHRRLSDDRRTAVRGLALPE